MFWQSESQSLWDFMAGWPGQQIPAVSSQDTHKCFCAVNHFGEDGEGSAAKAQETKKIKKGSVCAGADLV